MTVNQHGAFVVDGGKPILDPVAHCIFMFTEQLGDLFHRIAAVNLDEPMIRMTSSHRLAVIANLHAFNQPCFYLIIQPTDRPRPQVDRPREGAFLDTKINSRARQSSSLLNLFTPKDG